MAMYVPKLARLVIDAALDQPNPSPQLKAALIEYLNVYEGPHVKTTCTPSISTTCARAELIGNPHYQPDAVG